MAVFFIVASVQHSRECEWPMVLILWIYQLPTIYLKFN